MSKPHRIAAGGITFEDGAVLLVRYRDGSGGTYLVGPGGALKDNENVVQAIIRETMEETNVTVQPRRVAFIEDLVTPRFKMVKVWMVCDLVEGAVRRTEGAKKEGITEAGWFIRPQLEDEVVFPPALTEYDWNDLQSENWKAECLRTREARF